MGEISSGPEENSRYPDGMRNDLSPLCRGMVVDFERRRAVATSTGQIRTLEQRFQALCLFDAGLEFGTG